MFPLRLSLELLLGILAPATKWNSLRTTASALLSASLGKTPGCSLQFQALRSIMQVHVCPLASVRTSDPRFFPYLQALSLRR